MRLVVIVDITFSVQLILGFVDEKGQWENLSARICCPLSQQKAFSRLFVKTEGVHTLFDL